VSYDLTLFRVPEGSDPAAAFEELMEREEQGEDSAPAERQRIVEVLKACRPEAGMVIEVHHASVSIMIPYFRQQAMDAAMEIVEILRDKAGYSCFDPQLGRLVTRADLPLMAAEYRGMDRVLPAIAASTRKPWWKFW